MRSQARISGRLTDRSFLRVGFGIMLIACVVNAFMNELMRHASFAMGRIADRACRVLGLR